MKRYWLPIIMRTHFECVNLNVINVVVCRVLGLPADFKEGVVFSTYATLVSSVKSGGQYLS